MNETEIQIAAIYDLALAARTKGELRGRFRAFLDLLAQLPRLALQVLGEMPVVILNALIRRFRRLFGYPEDLILENLEAGAECSYSGHL